VVSAWERACVSLELPLTNLRDAWGDRIRIPEFRARADTMSWKWGVDLFDHQQIGRIGRNYWQCLLGAA
jgi:hypothetical protein